MKNFLFKFIVGVVLAVIISVGTFSLLRDMTNTNKKQITLKETIQTVQIIQLTENEAEYWKQLMKISYNRSGAFHADRAAQSADKIILELRKRTGGNE